MVKKYLFLFVCLILIGCKNNIFQTFDELKGIDHISKIELVNGQNGDRVEIKDEDNITRFLAFFENKKFTKSADQEAVKGYHYFASLIDEDGLTATITILGTTVKINDDYYDMDSTISNGEIEKFYNKRGKLSLTLFTR